MGGGKFARNKFDRHMTEVASVQVHSVKSVLVQKSWVEAGGSTAVGLRACTSVPQQAEKNK